MENRFETELLPDAKRSSALTKEEDYRKRETKGLEFDLETLKDRLIK